MGDLLASAADLRTLVEEDETGLPDARADLLIGLATGAVQAAAGQDLVQRDADAFTVLGTTEVWLSLPQRPVTAVASVAVDGQPVTEFKRFGARLWRRCGWAACSWEPSTVDVVYSHGYPLGDPALELARSTALALAARMFSNPIGATGLSIDDYSEQYSQSTNSDLSGLVPSSVRQALRRKYGVRGGLVRIG